MFRQILMTNFKNTIVDTRKAYFVIVKYWYTSSATGAIFFFIIPGT